MNLLWRLYLEKIWRMDLGPIRADDAAAKVIIVGEKLLRHFYSVTS